MEKVDHTQFLAKCGSAEAKRQKVVVRNNNTTRKVCAMPVGSLMNHHTPVKGVESPHTSAWDCVARKGQEIEY